MADEISYVQTWITDAVQIKVNQVDSCCVFRVACSVFIGCRDYLGGIEVAVDAAGARLGDTGTQPAAGGREAAEALGPFGFQLGNFGQALVQDSQFVGHSMPPFSWDVRLMQLVNRLGDSAGELD